MEETKETMTMVTSRRGILSGNSRGLALLTIVAILLVVAVMIGAGLGIRALLIKKEKLGESRGLVVGGVDGAMESIVSFAQANRRLPAAGTELEGILQSPLDSWKQNYHYVPDDDLYPSGSDICGRKTTGLSVITPSGTSISDIAFVIWSRGPNTQNQTGSTSPIQLYDVGATNIPTGSDLTYDDIVRWMTLNDLKIRLNCSAGNLRILNNELPKSCGGATVYNATVYADGGVPPYTWTPPTSNYLSFTPNGDKIVIGLANVFPTCASYPCYLHTFESEPNPYTFIVQDSDGNTAQKNLSIKLPAACAGSAGPPGAQVSFANDFNSFPNQTNLPPLFLQPGITKNADQTLTLGGANQWTLGCQWSPSCSTLFSSPPPSCSGDNYVLDAKIMRAYYEFRFLQAGVDGFTFALMQGANDGISYNTSCGGAWSFPEVGTLGYAPGLQGEQIAGNSVAVEFDVNRNPLRFDPTWTTDYTHVAIVRNGSTTHGSGGNAACIGMSCNPIPSTPNTGDGCIYDNQCNHVYSNDWFGGDTDYHRVRVEVHTRCDATCSTCDTYNPANTNYYLKVWIDRPADCTYSGSPDNTNICDLRVDFAGSDPDLARCDSLPVSMQAVKFGFTEATFGTTQNVTIATFGISFIDPACPALSIATASLPDGYAGQAYAATVSGSGGVTPFTWSASGLPAGLTIDPSTGVISGTPTQPGIYTVTVTVQDSCHTAPQSTSRSYPLTIGCAPFTGWSSSLPNAQNCSTYNGFVSVLGGAPPYLWSSYTGSLPAGINFCTGNTAATCSLTGTNVLSAPGWYNFTPQVTDSCVPVQSPPPPPGPGFRIRVQDNCYNGGMRLRNETGQKRSYQVDGGGSCNGWNNNTQLSVDPGHTYQIYTSTNCAIGTACAGTTDYCDQKSYNSDSDCNTRTGAGDNPCTYRNR